jgi:hypothetical protein
MSMGKRERARQPAMWVTTTELPTAASHPFYRCLNHFLHEYGFDDFAETQCAEFYAETMGRPSLPPGIYFRLLLIGYFEGIESERGIAWRAADSLALRDFLGVGLEKAPPDHSTIPTARPGSSLPKTPPAASSSCTAQSRSSSPGSSVEHAYSSWRDFTLSSCGKNRT